MAEPEDEAPPILLPCSFCNRTFKPETLEKHIKVCEKQATKKRKVFDSSKQRLQGTELAEYLPKVLREKKNERVGNKKSESNWKEKHLEFVAAIRAARGVEHPATSTSAVSKSNEKCPHCDRNFGPKAFDRHIEWCKEQKARIPKSPANLIQAKERLEARTKYRAPLLAKSKRTLTREKYARVAPSKESSPSGSHSAVTFSKPQSEQSKILDTTPRIQGIRNKPKFSSSSPSCTLPSGNSPVKRRESSPSPSKKPVRSNSKTQRKATVAPRNEESNNNASLFSSSCNITKMRPSVERYREKEVKPAPVEKSSSEEVYDPYVSAEKQMMELCDQGNFAQQTTQHNKSTYSSHSESCTVFPSFESSHQSAFVKYNPPNLSHLNNETVIPDSLIAEFQDLFIAGFKNSNYVIDNSIVTDEQNQNIPINLSNIGLNLNNNNFVTSQPIRKPSKIRAKMENAALSLQRSVQLLNYENDMKLGTEASSLVQPDGANNSLPTLTEFTPSPFSSPEPRVFPSSKSNFEKGDADKKIAEDTYSLLKCESSASGELFNQPKSYSAGGKFSADSAYGSLNRRSPTVSASQMPSKHEDLEGDRMCFFSSSSSESSLPPLCSVQVTKRDASNPSLSPASSCAVDASPDMQNVPRMSKFCHECGSKFPVSLAKFCCECGVRRLAM